MAIATNREEFKKYCLRKLGWPVIEINVDDEQVEDRIDEAFKLYWDYHYDGYEKTYVKYEVTQQDVDNGWLPVAENVLGVVNLFSSDRGVSGNSYTNSGAGSGLFSFRYATYYSAIFQVGSMDLITYFLNRQHLNMISSLLTGIAPIRYNRHRNRLYIDGDPLRVGEMIVYECYQIVDPDIFPDVWKDRFLTDYTVALIKQQWGTNMAKFSGLQLPGGVTLDGQRIYEEATQELRRLEELIPVEFALPPLDMIG